jgi:alkylhydroperoxidase family enzyme
MKIKHINYISERQALQDLKEIYKHIKLNFGTVAEPFVLHSLDAKLTAGIWVLLYETVIISNKVERSLKEAIATCVSEINKCTFCVDAHSIMLFGTDKKLIDKISKIKNSKIDLDSKTDNIINWALKSNKLDGEVTKIQPFTKEEAEEIIGTVILFNYINRMVAIFAHKTPLPMSFMKKQMQNIASKFIFNKAILKTKRKGESLKFLTDEYKQKYVDKTINYSEIKIALENFSFQIQHNIKDIISEELKLLLEKEAKKLHLLNDSLGKEKLFSFLQKVKNKDRQIAEFCFLVMFSPYKIYEKHINFLKQNYNDKEILYISSFCSFIIAENIGIYFNY